MQGSELHEQVLVMLEANNGKIELMETNVRIILYKERLHLGLGRKWDVTKISKVREIPKDAITKVELVNPGSQFRIHFPGAGLLGFVNVFLKEEQIPEATQIMNMLTKIESIKDNKNIAKIIDRRGISPDKVLLTAEGANGQIVLTDNGVIIGREGFWNKAITGYTKGEKFLPYKNIAGVQFKEPGLTWGYIQFTLPGGIESRGGAWDAGSDENTVTFNSNVLESFRKVRSIVEEKQYSPIPTTQTLPRSSIADELTKLAALKRDGAITEEEFELFKKDLLSGH